MYSMMAILKRLRTMERERKSFDEVDAVQRTVTYLVQPCFSCNKVVVVQKAGEPPETDMSVSV